MLIDSEETYKILCEEYPLLQKAYLRRVIDEVPSAEPNILDDGTLTITVPHGRLSKVNRVIVDEVGTKFCKMMYQDALPSAERKGHWIRTGEDGYCSECKCDMPIFREDWDLRFCETDFCPNCGARMVSEE